MLAILPLRLFFFSSSDWLPSGYVGYEEGGQLTSHVRRNPYTIVPVDEIEKVAPQFVVVFLQVLDDGRLTDGQGETVVIIVRSPHHML